MPLVRSGQSDAVDATEVCLAGNGMTPPIPVTCGPWPKPPGTTSASSPSEPPGSLTRIRTVAGPGQS